VHVISSVRGQLSRDYIAHGVWLHRRGQFDGRVIARLPSAGNARPAARRVATVAATWRALRGLPWRPDVVEAPDWFAEGLGVAVTRSYPLVVHLHTPLALTAPFGGSPVGRLDVADAIERLTARRADALTSPSRLLADDLARRGWLGSRRVRIIRYGIELDEFDRPGAPATEPLVVAVGRVEPRKGSDVLIRAAAILAALVPELRVVFVGRPGSADGYPEQLVRDVGAPCEFVPQVPRTEIADWLRRARVVAVPSRYDNFPMTAVEAMAAARPVVCTTRTGTAELFEGSPATDAVVPPGDHVALASALLPLLQDRVYADAAGLKARELVRTACDPQRIAAEREAVYSEAIERWRAHSLSRLRQRWHDRSRSCA
jgi:glycosyltransferase involved in cell wall biosynthesis